MSCTAIFFSSLLELGGIRVTLSVGDYRLHEQFEPGRCSSWIIWSGIVIGVLHSRVSTLHSCPLWGHFLSSLFVPSVLGHEWSPVEMD